MPDGLLQRHQLTFRAVSYAPEPPADAPASPPSSRLRACGRSGALARSAPRSPRPPWSARRSYAPRHGGGTARKPSRAVGIQAVDLLTAARVPAFQHCANQRDDEQPRPRANQHADDTGSNRADSLQVIAGRLGRLPDSRADDPSDKGAQDNPQATDADPPEEQALVLRWRSVVRARPCKPPLSAGVRPATLGAASNASLTCRGSRAAAELHLLEGL
jgi:hypothetical protein